MHGSCLIIAIAMRLKVKIHVTWSVSGGIALFTILQLLQIEGVYVNRLV